MVHPIVDQYYNHNPYHTRSSGLVISKGLDTDRKPANAKTALSDAPSTVGSDIGGLMPPILQDKTGSMTPTYYLARSPRGEPLHWQRRDPERPTVYESAIASPQLTHSGYLSADHSNTKKKRVAEESAQQNKESEGGDYQEQRDRKGSFRDPVKIGRFFPELTLPA